MIFTLSKIMITSLLIVAISEISKRSSFIAALLVSLPFISILAMVWLYIDTKDATKISELASHVFCLVIPSLAFFISLPLLLKKGLDFNL